MKITITALAMLLTFVGNIFAETDNIQNISNLDSPTVGRQGAGHEPQERGLPAPVPADQSHELAGLDRETDIPDRLSGLDAHQEPQERRLPAQAAAVERLPEARHLQDREATCVVFRAGAHVKSRTCRSSRRKV